MFQITYDILNFYAIRIYKMYVFQDHALIHFRRLYELGLIFWYGHKSVIIIYNRCFFPHRRNLRIHEIYFLLNKYTKVTVLYRRNYINDVCLKKKADDIFI